MVIVHGNGGYDSREAFPTAKKRGVRTTIRMRINANCLAGGVDRTRSKAVLKQLGGGCTAAQFAKIRRD